MSEEALVKTRYDLNDPEDIHGHFSFQNPISNELLYKGLNKISRSRKIRLGPVGGYSTPLEDHIDWHFKRPFVYVVDDLAKMLFGGGTLAINILKFELEKEAGDNIILPNPFPAYAVEYSHSGQSKVFGLDSDFKVHPEGTEVEQIILDVLSKQVKRSMKPTKS